MPCSHQCSLGAEKPSVPQAFNVTFRDTWSKSVLEVRTAEREPADQSQAHATPIKDLAVRNIGRFSRSRNRDEIRKYVEDNFAASPNFALGLPISVLNLISRGIEHFRKKE
jgi:hypothetical protein